MAKPDLDIAAIRAGAESPQIADLAGAMAAAEDLAAAFVADPLISWFSRTDSKRDAARLRFFRHILKELAFARGDICRPLAGGAAAVWLPSENMGPNPLHKEIAALPALIGLTGWSRFARLLDVRAALDKHHPLNEPHDYLFFLGVTPAAQGHGIGSRLLAARCAELDARGRAAHLETATQANVRLYRRFGFEITAEFRPGKTGPQNWAMWRAPRRA